MNRNRWPVLLALAALVFSAGFSSAADQYNNKMTLLPGPGWDPATLKSGAWVIVQGQPEPGTDPAPSCTAHGYQVTTVAPNPAAPE